MSRRRLRKLSRRKPGPDFSKLPEFIHADPLRFVDILQALLVVEGFGKESGANIISAALEALAESARPDDRMNYREKCQWKHQIAAEINRVLNQEKE